MSVLNAAKKPQRLHTSIIGVLVVILRGNHNARENTNMDYVKAFWESNEKYHDLVETFDRGITRVHPGFVTSDGACSCWLSVHKCSWCSQKVDYYEYRGESV